ncbi:MAG: hypothetical protein JWL73_3338 [Actinomycetia bacterium]|nr:hypothetical protein [Actinomycetes bacterium]
MRVWLAVRLSRSSTRAPHFLHLGRIAHAAEATGLPEDQLPDEDATDLPALATSPAVARRFVGDVLSRFGADPESIATASLLTSELVTNSVVHARSPVRVSVGRRGRSVRVGVTDFVPGDIEPRPIDPERPNGRGLLLVSMLATSWSVEPVPGGKTVCFELVTKVYNRT